MQGRHLKSPLIFLSKFRSQSASTLPYPSIDDYVALCRNLFNAAKEVRIDSDMRAVLTTSYVCDEPILSAATIDALQSLAANAKPILTAAKRLKLNTSNQAASAFNESAQQFVARNIKLDCATIELFAITLSKLIARVKGIEDMLCIQVNFESEHENSISQHLKIREKSFYVSAVLNQLKKVSEQAEAVQKLMNLVISLDFINVPQEDDTSYYARTNFTANRKTR